MPPIIRRGPVCSEVASKIFWNSQFVNYSLPVVRLSYRHIAARLFRLDFPITTRLRRVLQ